MSDKKDEAESLAGRSPLRDKEFRKAITGDDAAELAELGIIEEDLRVSYKALRLFFDKYVRAVDGSEEKFVAGSLFRDAVIQFCGCFSTNQDAKFKPNPADVFSEVPQWEERLQWFKDLRDGYAAHNFSIARQHGVFAVMTRDEERKRIGFVGVGEVQVRWIAPGETDRDWMLAFVEVAGRFVKKLMDQKRDALRDRLAAIGPDALSRLPDYEPPPPPKRNQFRVARATQGKDRTAERLKAVRAKVARRPKG